MVSDYSVCIKEKKFLRYFYYTLIYNYSTHMAIHIQIFQLYKWQSNNENNSFMIKQYYLKNIIQSTSLTIMKPSIYNLSVFKFSTKQSYSVQSILYHQQKNPLFVYQQTKQVCNTIKTLFYHMHKYPEENTKQLSKLFQRVHLSSFNSWKLLQQTADTVNIALNQNLNCKSLSKKQLLSLCQVLRNLNYDLHAEKDDNFITNQIIPNFSFSDLTALKSQHDLQQLFAISSHSSLLSLFSNHKEMLQVNLISAIKNQSQITKHSQHLISNLIKNGIYQTFWHSTFLQNISHLIQENQMITQKYKSLMNALNLNGNSTATDQWTIQNTNTNNVATSVVTQQKIFNILKQLDYVVETNQAIFQYQIDYKLPPNLIVQYHGVHHYQINTNNPVETMKSKWKVDCLRRKGYRVFVIPFYNWNQLQTIYQKKKWLIQNMERSLFSQ